MEGIVVIPFNAKEVQQDPLLGPRIIERTENETKRTKGAAGGGAIKKDNIG